MMVCTLLPFYLLWLSFRYAASAPIVEVPNQGVLKRAKMSPQMDGVNFPDPTIIYSDKWYGFATRTIGSSIHIQIATSSDFTTWSIVRDKDGTQVDALPDLPAWVADKTAGASNVWAPDINVLDDGTFIIYFSASTATDPSKHCVGAATSKHILGPYTAQAKALFCPLSQGGAIDASGFQDPVNGERYVVYKVDGNSIGHGGACGNTVAPLVSTPLVLQPVASDGVTFNGQATTLLDHNGSGKDGVGTDDGIVEAPALVKHGSTYFLFFSPGCFTTSHYKVAYATAPSITGPYTRAARPLIQTGDDGLSGPGGADLSREDGFIAFHANYANGRALYTARVAFSGKTASII